MRKEAIILAGGFGTRLQHVLHDLPKPMASIGNKPFLSYLFDYLLQYDYTHVVLSTGYLHEKIENYFHNTYKNLQLAYAHETEPLGTGGAIAFSLSKCLSNDILILNGDTFFKINLFSFYSFHQNNNSLLTIALRQVKDVSRYGSVEIDNQRKIISFKEKEAATGNGLINGGVYLLNKKLLQNIPQSKFSFEKDILEKFYKEQSFYGYPFSDYFIDIGIPDDYEKAQKELLKNTYL
ncbi:MAG: nucleotidyltransferase family protein [Prevotellaceae bacterium]|jgi:D-glycero-alpha-D-manno-heptose 1-phosphate guanylyltransferase|nr:nucleotidyltransferase family protein [Prevotellaceae bacterium]